MDFFWNQTFWVRDDWHFEEKSGKIEIVTLIWYHQRSEETFQVNWVQRTAVIGGWRQLWYLKFCIWSRKFNFYFGKVREKSGNFENWCLWQPWFIGRNYSSMPNAGNLLAATKAPPGHNNWIGQPCQYIIKMKYILKNTVSHCTDPGEFDSFWRHLSPSNLIQMMQKNFLKEGYR